MAFTVKGSAGYSGSQVEFTKDNEVAYVCGNALALQQLDGGQRLIRGSSFGIQAFAVNRAKGLLAIAEKGPSPSIQVYATDSLQLQATVNLGFGLGYSALAFSADGDRLGICGEEPDNQIVIYRWREGEKLAKGIPPPGFGVVRQISFHPYDHDRVAVTGASATHVWHLDRLWDKNSFSHYQVSLEPSGSGVESGTHPTTCHAWFPAGLYVGTATGRLYSLVIETLYAQAHPHGLSGAGAGQQGAAAAQAANDAASEAAKDHHGHHALKQASSSSHAGDAFSTAAAAAIADLADAPPPVYITVPGEQPVTALSVTRDLVGAGTSEGVAWFLHTHNVGGYAATPARLYTSHSLGPGASLLGLSCGGGPACTWAAGTADGRVLKLDLEPVSHAVRLIHQQSAAGSGEQSGGQQQGVSQESDSPRNGMHSLYGHNSHEESLHHEEDGAEGAGAQQQQQQQQQPQLPPVSPPVVTTLMEAHVGPVAAMRPHPEGQALVSVGSDGTLRVWAVTAPGAGVAESSGSLSGTPRGSMAATAGHHHVLHHSRSRVSHLPQQRPGPPVVQVACRAFSSALTALAVAPPSAPCGALMSAVGSETGVLRLVTLPSAPAPPSTGSSPLHSRRSHVAMDGPENAPPSPGVSAPDKLSSNKTMRVTWRRRLHTGGITAVAFSPDGSMLASAGKDNCIWFLSLNHDGSCLPLGYIRSPDTVLDMVWPEVQDMEEVILVSLASGAVLSASAPVELHAASRPTVGADLALTARDVMVKVVRIESALLKLVPIAGERYGELIGMGADKMMHKIILPVEGQAWAGTKGRTHKSAARAAVHARPEGAMAATPSHQLLLTGSSDGTVATHNLSLMTLGALESGPARPPGVPTYTHTTPTPRQNADSPLNQGGRGSNSVSPLLGDPGSPLRSGQNSLLLPPSLQHKGATSGSSGPSPSPPPLSVAQQGLAAYSQGANTGLHDIAAGGVCAVSFDHSGRFFLSAGADGSLFVYETKGALHLTREQAARQHPALHPEIAASEEDCDQFDQADEVTEVALYKSRQQAAPAHSKLSVHGAAPAAGAASADAIVSRLSRLRAALSACVTANENAPELEKVDRNSFIIDLTLVSELQAAADTQLASVRETIQREQLELEVVTERVRTSCWESQLVHGQRVTSMKAPGLEVWNFPLLPDAPRVRLLSKVAFLRRVELVERRQVAQEKRAAEVAAAQSLAAQQAAIAAAAAAAQAALVSGPSIPGTESSSGPSLAPAAASHSGHHPVMSQRPSLTTNMDDLHGDDGDDLMSPTAHLTGVSSLMYSPFELHCQTRKAGQIHLLKQQIRDVKVRFNEEWEKAQRQKRADADKVADLNFRLEDIAREITKLGGSAPPVADMKFSVPFPEDMSTVLSVKDEEVEVDKYSEQDGSAEGGAAGGGGAGGRGGAGEAGAAERALKHMMGGTLANRNDDKQDFVLVKPEWMDGNPKLFSEDQLRELRAFQALEKQMSEEKAKRVSVLEQELRTVRAALEDTTQRFDDNLAAVAARRAAAHAQVAALEARVISLALNMGAVLASSETAEREAYNRLASSKDSRAKVAAELAEKRGLQVQMEARAGELQAEQKAMDKNFKREFGSDNHHEHHHNAHYYQKLLHLYRTRFAAERAKARVGATLDVGPSGGGAALASWGDKSKMSRAGSLTRSSDHTNANQQAPARGQQQQGGGRGGPGSIMGPGSLQQPSLAVSSLQGVLLHGAHGHVPEGEDPLTSLMAHPVVVDLQASTPAAWPELPSYVAALVPSTALEPGALPEGYEEESETVDDSLMPDGLDEDMWARFQAYRGSRIHTEIELRRLSGGLAVLKREVPSLEAAEAAAAAAADAAMADVQSLRANRKAALFDVDMMLNMKAGQVEATPTSLVSSDMSHALLLNRSIVEGVNGVVQGRGARNVGLLTAIKDFRKGCYQLEWEHKRCDMLIDELRERVRELQLLHVTRDMQAVFRNDGSAAAAAAAIAPTAANETAALEALARQRDRLHRKTLLEKQKTLKKIEKHIGDKAAQNADVARHLVGLQKVLDEQQRLRASMGASDEAAERRLKALVTHKKLKEIALAQADEVRALAAELDRLRLKTYPTFVEPTASVFPADTRLITPTYSPSSPTLQSPQGGSRRGRQGFQGATSPGSAAALLPLNRSHPNLSFGGR